MSQPADQIGVSAAIARQRGRERTRAGAGVRRWRRRGKAFGVLGCAAQPAGDLLQHRNALSVRGVFLSR